MKNTLPLTGEGAFFIAIKIAIKICYRIAQNDTFFTYQGMAKSGKRDPIDNKKALIFQDFFIVVGAGGFEPP